MPYIGQSPATGEANSFKTLDEHRKLYSDF